ncbi:hypothetical protein EBT31_17755 [bacterium]|jgi:hypothetical protein|nr:hypothetical protein [bacterium]
MKGRKGRAAGGESPAAGSKEWEQDLASKPERRVNAATIMNAAEERKRGGKAVGKVHGAAAKMHAGRKARKAGGRTGSNMNPLSSAHAGTPAKGRKLDSMGQ